MLYSREGENTYSLFIYFFFSPSNTITICPFLPSHALQQYSRPSHSNSTAPPPPPPAPCSGFFFPWIFASQHADGPLALPDGSVFPPPPPAVLLFHSKMASALEPLVCSCIFRLVVVSVPHGFGTLSSAARREIPVSSSGSRLGGHEIHLFFFFARSALPELHSVSRTGPARAFWGNRERRKRERGVQRDGARGGGGWGHGAAGGPRPSFSAPAALSSQYRRLQRYVGGQLLEGGSTRDGDRL